MCCHAIQYYVEIGIVQLDLYIENYLVIGDGRNENFLFSTQIAKESQKTTTFANLSNFLLCLCVIGKNL